MSSESTTRQLLVRSGGRCALCYGELLTSNFTQKSVYLGEKAHIVGRSKNARSPRGDSELPAEARDDADNLLMLCASCHNEIDSRPNLDDFSVGRLRALKQRHESRVAQILAVPPGKDTGVLRVHGTIGDSQVNIDRSACAAAVLEQGRCARFPLSHDPAGIEIDLRRASSPDIGNGEYYRVCQESIDRVFDRQVTPAVEAGDLRHVSVFALARWPLLVHLGARVGDKLNVDVYQRHRATESWSWPANPGEHHFSFELVADGKADQDAVLLLSVSAPVHDSEVPDGLANCRIYRIESSCGCIPQSDIVDSPSALKSAERALRDVFADIEHHRKAIRRFHILGAAPFRCASRLAAS